MTNDRACKTFTDSKFNIRANEPSDKEENIVEVGKNAGYQHFLLFPQCVQKPFSQGPENHGLFTGL